MLIAPVPGVPIPVTEEAEDWMTALLGQSGALDKANDKEQNKAWDSRWSASAD